MEDALSRSHADRGPGAGGQAVRLDLRLRPRRAVARSVGRGDRVAILAANCPEWLVTFWAVTSLGAVAVGLNGWWARDEILFGMEDCDPVLLVGDRRRLERIKGATLKVPVVEIESEFEALWNRYPDAALPDQPIHEDDPASILYTSGTTGEPKGVTGNHQSLAHFLQWQVMEFDINAGDRVAQLTAPSFDVILRNPLFQDEIRHEVVG